MFRSYECRNNYLPQASLVIYRPHLKIRTMVIKEMVTLVNYLSFTLSALCHSPKIHFIYALYERGRKAIKRLV